VKALNEDHPVSQSSESEQILEDCPGRPSLVGLGGDHSAQEDVEPIGHVTSSAGFSQDGDHFAQVLTKILDPEWRTEILVSILKKQPEMMVIPYMKSPLPGHL
jgi:hypothetical protein